MLFTIIFITVVSIVVGLLVYDMFRLDQESDRLDEIIKRIDKDQQP